LMRFSLCCGAFHYKTQLVPSNLKQGTSSVYSGRLAA
jgi:hypothetical protein